jgi:hypothetical protein
MAKKKKVVGRNEAFTELKTLESKWLKDRRLDPLEPVQVKVLAAKTAAVLDFIEKNHLPIEVSVWPLMGAEEWMKLDEASFKQGLSSLQKVGIINDAHRFRKVASSEPVFSAEHVAAGELLTYRCVKPGGVSLSDRDEYVLEDQEVSYSEEAIAESPTLQNAIANEWLMRIETPRHAE